MQKDKKQKLQITNGTKYQHKKIRCDKMQSNKIQTEKNTNQQNTKLPKMQKWQNTSMAKCKIINCYISRLLTYCCTQFIVAHASLQKAKVYTFQS